jgi:hypothetical protein
MSKKIKDKICPICENTFKPIYSTLQQVCSAKCALAFNSEKEVKKRVEKMKIEVEGTTQLEKLARIVFQKWIRERDKDFPCISCGATDIELGPNMFDAGHFFSAERFSGLIFDETNVHRQCKKCNGVNMHGNLAEYRKGLSARYGEDYVFELESISDFNRVYKYSREELVEIANKYKNKLKLLKK